MEENKKNYIKIFLSDIKHRICNGTMIHIKGTVTTNGETHPIEYDTELNNESMLNMISPNLDEDWHEVKVWLLPLSAMTSEQKRYIYTHWGVDDTFGFECEDLDHVPLNIIGEYIGWLIENHFDYNGLIEKGLALNAEGKNIYTNNYQSKTKNENTMKNELIYLLEKHKRMSDYNKSVLDTIDFTLWLDTYNYSDISDMMNAMDKMYSNYTKSDDILNGMLFRWMDETELVKYLKERYADKFDVEEQVMYIIKNKNS